MIKPSDCLTQTKVKVSRFIIQKECRRFSLFCGRLMESIFFRVRTRLTSGLGRLRLRLQLASLPTERLKRFNIESNFWISLGLTRKSKGFKRLMFQSTFWLPKESNIFRPKKRRELWTMLSFIMKPSLRFLNLKSKEKLSKSKSNKFYFIIRMVRWKLHMNRFHILQMRS